MVKRYLKNSPGITIAILLVAIVGLSIGFAAFSSNLSISGSARINPNASNFSLVFANNTDINHLDFTDVNPSNNSTGTGSNLTINNVAQGGPQLTNIAVTFNKPGQVVIYDLYVVNNGHYDAYLTDLVFNNVEGSNQTKTCDKITEGYSSQQWASTESLNSVCSSISVNVEVDGTVYSSTSSLDNILVEKGSNKTLRLTVSYTGSTRADGPMRIRLGSISINAATIESQIQGGGEETPQSNPWITERNLTSSNIIFDTVYSSALGDVIFYSNGDFEFAGNRILSSEIDDMLSNSTAFVDSDGFAYTDGEDHFFFWVVENGVTRLYICPMSEPFNRQSIIDAATDEGDVFDFEVSSWVKRGIKTQYASFDASYNSDLGNIILNFDGSLVFLGDSFSSTDVNTNISGGDIIIYQDGFAYTDGEDNYLFTFTGVDAATLYISPASESFERQSIIDYAIEDDAVIECTAVRVNPWLTRGDGVSTDYVVFDGIYKDSANDIEMALYSTGGIRFIDQDLSSSSFSSLLSSNQAFVYNDGYLMSPDGSNYYLFIAKGDGTAKFYISGLGLSDAFSREAVIAKHAYEYDLILVN